MNPEQFIPWKTRADLLSVENAAPATGSFTVKDPVKDEFFYFSQLEYFFIRQLRGPQTFASLMQDAAAEFGRKFGIGEVQSYLNHLANDNLIVPIQMGDGERLYRQRRLEQSSQWKQQIIGLLSIKLPGIHPGGFLHLLKPAGYLFFNPVSLALFLFVVFATVVFAAFSFSTLAGLAPGFSQLLTPEHVVAVLIGFVVAKILHELGHAVACQYTDHECTEMGVLFLVFMPCLYCDVSDLWTEQKRWKRVMVSLAGVYVELAIAVICFWVWFLTVPGPLHYFCYSMMLITSVNTLFINGNPLMRYDGYYALSDLTGIHNLATVSRQYFSRQMGRLFLKGESTVDSTPKSGFLLMYAICSMLYRWIILFAIAFGIWKFFDMQQLQAIGNSVVAVIAIIAIMPMLIGIKSALKAVSRFGLRWFNAAICLALLVSIFYLVLGFEFSHRIWGQAEIHLADPEYVFASSDGKFLAKVEDGQIVASGDLIGRIENSELELEHLDFAGQLRDTRMNLKFIAVTSDSHLLAGQAEHWKKREATLQRQLMENQRKRNDLIIRSPSRGQIVGFQSAPQTQQADALDERSGSLLDEQNADGQIERGAPICYVGKPERLRALIDVDEKEIEFVRIGQEVKIAVPFQSEFLVGTVADIALENESEQSSQSSIEGDLENRVTYQVEVEFAADSRIRVGSIQQAVILCQQTTTAKFLGRWLRNSFWF